MVPGFDIPISSLRSHAARLDVTANNIANLNTEGFKSSRADFATQGGDRGTTLAATPRDTSQGPLQFTGKPTDVAIEGNGFLSVRRSDGSLGFTRAGSLMLDGAGNLTLPNGGSIDPAIRIPSDAQSVSIAGDGTVSVAKSDGSVQTVGQINVTTFPNPAGLEAVGENLFRPTPASGPGNRTAPGTGSAGNLRVGTLEGSNVDLATEMVNLIVGERGFQAQLAVVKTQDEVQQTLLDLKR